MENVIEKYKYDPWDVKQEIADVKVKIHCARYWMLSEWECNNMSFPFWRLYHSTLGGSFIKFGSREIELKPDKLIMIPPYTAFSTRLKSNGETQFESIKGFRIASAEDIQTLADTGCSDQLFIHFNLGYPMDRVKNEISEISIDDYWLQVLAKIESNRLQFPNQLDYTENMKVVGLILYALQNIPKQQWGYNATDERVQKVIAHIENNLHATIVNDDLAELVNMSTGAFARIFKELLKCPVQQYITQKRIEKAVLLLHYSDDDINEISVQCGFYDRHHFSKIFRKVTGLAPASYRKKVRQGDFS